MEVATAFDAQDDDEYELYERTDRSGRTTQLSEQYPQIDAPLRIDPPQNLKVPQRTEPLSRNQQICESSFSPKAFSFTTKPLPSVREKNDSSRRVKSLPQSQALSKTAVADFSMLATSSHRAGKAQMEGQAHLAMAITLDNSQQYEQAMDCYRKLLNLCVKLGDSVVEGLAHNCLGVDAMLIACPPDEVNP